MAIRKREDGKHAETVGGMPVGRRALAPQYAMPLALQRQVGNAATTRLLQLQHHPQSLQLKPDASNLPTMKKGTKPTDAVRLLGSMTYKPKSGPAITGSRGLGDTDLKAEIPHGTVGILTFAVDARYLVDWGEKYSTEWLIDATGEELKISPSSVQTLDSEILSSDDFKWSTGVAADQISIGLDATFEKWFQPDDHYSNTVRLSLEQSFPNAKVEGPDEVTVTYMTDYVVKPFAIGSATITPKLLDGIEQFWNSLSDRTRQAIRDNELPGGQPVILDGYASTTGSRGKGKGENFSLAYDRAVAVMDVLKELSGNRSDEKLFKTVSHGEYQSPTSTDVKSEEKESADYRVVVIRISEEQTFTAEGAPTGP